MEAIGWIVPEGLQNLLFVPQNPDTADRASRRPTYLPVSKRLTVGGDTYYKTNASVYKVSSHRRSDGMEYVSLVY